MKINNLQLKIYRLGRRRQSCLLSFVIAIFTLLIIKSPAFAQEVSLSIAPPITELTIQPGKSFTQMFRVKNEGVPVVVAIKILPFVPFDNQGHAELIEDESSVKAFSSWFFFEPESISLGTTKSHDFRIRITPPPGTEEKDYYFTFIAEVQNENNLGVSASQAKIRVGANILVSVSKNGDLAKKASIIKFSAPKFIDSFSPLTYNVLIGNSGHSFFKPEGKITIDQVFGSSTVLNIAPLNILVGGSRVISCLQGEELIPCKMPGRFLVGIYRANLSFTIDGTGASIEKQLFTIAFPFSIVIGLIIVFIIYRIIRKFTAQ